MRAVVRAVVRVLSSAMRCAFAAVVATAALYEPLRWFSTLLFPWLDEEVGVGGVGGLTNMRFTQSFLEALGPDRVLGIGDDARFADSEFGAGIVHAPTLHLASWNFTGGAEG